MPKFSILISFLPRAEEVPKKNNVAAWGFVHIAMADGDDSGGISRNVWRSGNITSNLLRSGRVAGWSPKVFTTEMSEIVSKIKCNIHFRISWEWGFNSCICSERNVLYSKRYIFCSDKYHSAQALLYLWKRTPQSTINNQKKAIRAFAHLLLEIFCQTLLQLNHTCGVTIWKHNSKSKIWNVCFSGIELMESKPLTKHKKLYGTIWSCWLLPSKKRGITSSFTGWNWLVYFSFSGS